MNKAQKPNPALKPLGALVGAWATQGTHPYVPGKVLSGTAKFEWLEGGAFLVMRAHIEDERFPDGVSVFGSDDAAGALFMLYFDERGTSRKYDVSFENDVLTLWRDDPGFSQRIVLTLSPDHDTIVSKGEMNRDSKGWEPDLQLTYARAKAGA